MHSTNEMMHRLRQEKPPCVVCQRPCDPDATAVLDTVVVLGVPHDALSERVGLLVFHKGCEAEAMARLKKGQAIAEVKKIRRAQEADWERAQRLKAQGKAVDLG